MFHKIFITAGVAGLGSFIACASGTTVRSEAGDIGSVSPVTADFIPAGTYSGTALDAMQNVENTGGRNGARGPDYLQLDARVGWRHRISSKTLELFLDIYNITNRANFDNPVLANRDRRTPNNFLVLTNLRGGGGFPRQALMGARFVF